MEIHAGMVEALLSERHKEDVFVPECKTGPSQTSFRCPRMDGWAMSRSWAHWKCTGYEIKVSRRDFLGDDKMRDYLPFCHELYVVAPAGIVLDGELPPEIGLLKVSTNGKRLTTVKKAPFRQVEIPQKLLVYVLMARAKITPPNQNGTDKAEFWRRYVEGRTEDRELGYMVRQKLSKHIRKLTDERDEAVRAEKAIREGVAALKAAGIDPEGVSEWNVKARIAAIRDGIPPEMRRRLVELQEDAARVVAMLDGL